MSILELTFSLALAFGGPISLYLYQNLNYQVSKFNFYYANQSFTHSQDQWQLQIYLINKVSFYVIGLTCLLLIIPLSYNLPSEN